MGIASKDGSIVKANKIKMENVVKKKPNFLKMINIIVKHVLEIKNTRYPYKNIKNKKLKNLNLHH